MSGHGFDLDKVSPKYLKHNSKSIEGSYEGDGGDELLGIATTPVIKSKGFLNYRGDRVSFSYVIA
jgi:hypothetical protein